MLALGGLSLIPAYLHAYALSGPSDIPTVLLGDKVVVSTAAYSLRLQTCVTLFADRPAKRGDFVLLRLNKSQLKSPFFKRIMGLPGEVIEIRENRVMINGSPIPVRDLNLIRLCMGPRGAPLIYCAG